jgi:hypothetical protein
MHIFTQKSKRCKKIFNNLLSIKIIESYRDERHSSHSTRLWVFWREDHKKLASAIKQAKFEFEINYLNEVKEFCQKSPFKINRIGINFSRPTDEGYVVPEYYINYINDFGFSHPCERDNSPESWANPDSGPENLVFFTDSNIEFVKNLENFLNINYLEIFPDYSIININLVKFTLNLLRY